MMKHTKKEKQQSSLIHQKINKASFVNTEPEVTKRFKYNSYLFGNKYISDKLVALTNTCRKWYQMGGLKLNKFDFVSARNATLAWLVNAFIEGFIINFSAWGLLGWRFNLITIMAWGFATKQLIDIYWRLKTNGSNTKLPKKYN